MKKLYIDKQHNTYFYLYPEEYNVLNLLFKYSLEEVIYKKIYEGPANECFLQLVMEGKDIEEHEYELLRSGKLYYSSIDGILLHAIPNNFLEWFDRISEHRIYLIKV